LKRCGINAYTDIVADMKIFYIIFLSIYLSCSGPVQDVKALDPAVKAEVDSKISALETKYNITIYKSSFSICQSVKSDIIWNFMEPSDDYYLYQDLIVFEKNWDLLPAAYVKNTGLRGIVFIKDLQWGGLAAGGWIDWVDKVVIYNVLNFGVPFSSYYSSTTDDWASHAILHEYYHLIDNLTLYAAGYPLLWSAQNETGAVYTNSLDNGYARQLTDHPQTGFLNGYCTADLYQDRAEIFSYLLIPKLKSRALQWLPSDSYLLSKWNRIKDEMRYIDPTIPSDYFD
jgi:hypothetical protein